LITILSDVVAIEASFILSYWLRFHSPLVKYFPLDGNIPPIGGYLFLSAIVIPVWILIFQTRKMYRPRRVVFIFDEFFAITRLASFAIVFSFGLIFFYRIFPYSRFVFVLIWLISIIFITFGRYIVLKLEKTFYNKGRALKNTILAGNNTLASEIYENFSTHVYAGYRIKGYVELEGYGGDNFMEGKKKLGSFNDIVRIVKENDVDIVLVAIPSKENDLLFDLMKLCEGENIEFLLAPDFLEMITSSVRVQEIDGIPFLKLKAIPMNVWNRALKRVFDFLFSLTFLILTSPLLLIIAALVKFTSPGPVFYRQERLSMTGKKFHMYKFRSMIKDAEKDTGAVFVSKNDTRYTRVGKILRKFSLDELPQYINVLKGEMSVVGPRPEREYFIDLMKNQIPKYLDRHRVKCGITGWAQVNGFRGTDTSLEKRIELDIYYIENWSIVFDLKIVLKTFKEMFFSKAAF